MGNTKRAKPLTLPEREHAKVLSALGTSMRQIGVELGRNDKTIAKALRQPEVDKELGHIRVQLFTAIEAALLEHMLDPARWEKESINNLAYAFTQINNARRLEEGRTCQSKSQGIARSKGLRRFRADKR